MKSLKKLKSDKENFKKVTKWKHSFWILTHKQIIKSRPDNQTL